MLLIFQYNKNTYSCNFFNYPRHFILIFYHELQTLRLKDTIYIFPRNQRFCNKDCFKNLHQLIRTSSSTNSRRGSEMAFINFRKLALPYFL